MKIIFGNLPPIRKVHTDMLKRLKELEANWSEEACIGTIILGTDYYFKTNSLSPPLPLRFDFDLNFVLIFV